MIGLMGDIFRVGDTLASGRYHIDRLLGRGGMAVVYGAWDERLERAVAVKVMKTGLGLDDGHASRFRREAQAMASLSHPNVVTVYDTGEEPCPQGPPVAYFVMEQVHGPSLDGRLKTEGPLPLTEAVRISRQVLAALSASHIRGMVHRDIKPANVLLTGEGFAKVADFGIMRAVDGAGSTALTGTHAVIGTLPYMAPEQFQGRATPDARSDLYAVGVVLFQMLTGTLPFDGADSLALMYQHAMQAPPTLASRGTDAGPHLEAVIARALAKNPDDRYPDAQAMRTALTAPTSAGTPSVPSRPGSAASPPGTPQLPELPEASKPPAHGPHAQTRTAEAPSPPPVPGRPVDPEMLALISLTREAAEAERLEDTPAACRLYAELAERSARKLGPVAVATLLARHNHAHWAGEAGDAAKARDLMAAVAKDRTRVLGANHPDTLASRHEYALWMGVAGDARKARAQMRAVVSDRTGLLGANHPDALASRHDYARWTGEAGAGQRASSLFASVVEDRTRVLGADHPDTLVSRHNYAHWVAATGDVATARDLFAAVVKDRTRMLGADHPHTLVSRHSHAVLVGATGDPAWARDLLAAVAADHARALGASHPDTLRIRESLAQWTDAARR